MPTKGIPALSAISMTLHIFFACISPRLPARAVKSWAKAATGRPSTLPKPVMTPSAAMSAFFDPEHRPTMLHEHIRFTEMCPGRTANQVFRGQ